MLTTYEEVKAFAEAYVRPGTSGATFTVLPDLSIDVTDCYVLLGGGTLSYPLDHIPVKFIGTPESLRLFDCPLLRGLGDNLPSAVSGIYNVILCDNLESLAGGPSSVGSFMVEDCKALASLEGCPRTVRDSFTPRVPVGCRLRLEHLPESVGGDAYTYDIVPYPAFRDLLARMLEAPQDTPLYATQGEDTLEGWMSVRLLACPEP